PEGHKKVEDFLRSLAGTVLDAVEDDDLELDEIARRAKLTPNELNGFLAQGQLSLPQAMTILGGLTDANATLAVSIVTAPAFTSDLTLSGDEEVGSTLTVGGGTTSGTGTVNKSYTWLRADSEHGLNEFPIPGATAATYTLTEDDEGKFVRCMVTAT